MPKMLQQHTPNRKQNKPTRRIRDTMKIILQGYNKSIHKKNNQIIIKEKDQTLYKTNPKKNNRHTNNRKRIHHLRCTNTNSTKQHTNNINKQLRTNRIHTNNTKQRQHNTKKKTIQNK